MAPYEALYGGLLDPPMCWMESGEPSLIGQELVQETTNKIQVVRDRLLVAQSRHKSYADHRRRPLEFQIGDHVFLHVTPWKGVFRFGKRGKLAPRYFGPFEILQKIGEVAYKLALPPQLSSIHDVFHVSMLRKYEPDTTHVLDWQDLNLQEDVMTKVQNWEIGVSGMPPPTWVDWATTSGLAAWRPLYMGAAARFPPFHLHQLGLKHKGVNFDRNDKCEESFQELKRRLTTTLVLITPISGEKIDGKANVVADALSRKTQCVLSGLVVSEWKIQQYCIRLFKLKGKEAQVKEEVMKEAHQSWFTIHPGETKMYHDLRRQCWWQGLPRTPQSKDTAWVIVDRLMKSTHFLAMGITDLVHALNLNLQEDITYEEGLREILDKKEQILRTKTIPLVKVLWDHHGVEEATWELESVMRNKYLELFIGLKCKIEELDLMAAMWPTISYLGGLVAAMWLANSYLAAWRALYKGL
ncbi:hypothetical protein CK203_062551 [Vitis vinifera]|uniref:Uncharacterized protein n=1 Tax=Vitis vinifera TaxID=29760 RepID=A0A438FYG2_VITVI|nr:hypothetical protein CK203_062551 [Vitis vinifera]